MKKEWRVKCVTEGQNVYVAAEDEPTECPNDAGHEIDASATAILGSLKTQPYAAPNFSDGTNPYIEISETSFVSLGCEYFHPDMRDLEKMIAVVDKTGTADNAVVRVVNEATGETIFRAIWNMEGKMRVIDDEINSQPDEETCLNVQVKVKDAADSVKVYSVLIF